MKRMIFLLLAVVLVSLAAAPVVHAAMPVGTCPPNFDLHAVEDHEHMEHHIGLEVDLNQNGFLCVFVNPAGWHVHMDDVIQ